MQINRTLRYGRIVVSVVAFAAATSGLACYGMLWPRVAAWMESIQLIPATLTLSLTTFVIWLVVTLLFGRIYCSSVCPLGTMQDIIARLRRCGRHDSSKDYHYSPPLNRWRYGSLLIVLGSLMSGWLLYIPALLSPWSAYERIAVNCLRPVVGEGINAFSELGELASLWHTPPVTVAIASALGAVVAVVTLIGIGVLAARNGRTFCNTLCPAGSLLSFVSNYAVFKIDIDTDKCIQCRRCEHVCKSACINLTDHVVDGSRCVNCFDCINVCPNDAIRYTTRRKQLSIPMMQQTTTSLTMTSENETIS
ncbi:MAG: 4Fe-4S binding protein [Bacteroidales bacterium]|nr:4Fe-4S binding protein [Bacteroidales bacterium]